MTDYRTCRFFAFYFDALDLCIVMTIFVNFFPYPYFEVCESLCYMILQVLVRIVITLRCRIDIQVDELASSL